mmetsp:Transcript_935/g.2854  ORF Transcript_935/g.2854 Transcript_935/m.2854 type:complete len:247 (+) Transcript_935:664-1404(+)
MTGRGRLCIWQVVPQPQQRPEGLRAGTAGTASVIGSVGAGSLSGNPGCFSSIGGPHGVHKWTLHRLHRLLHSLPIALFRIHDDAPHLPKCILNAGINIVGELAVRRHQQCLNRLHPDIIQDVRGALLSIAHSISGASQLVDVAAVIAVAVGGVGGSHRACLLVQCREQRLLIIAPFLTALLSTRQKAQHTPNHSQRDDQPQAGPHHNDDDGPHWQAISAERRWDAAVTASIIVQTLALPQDAHPVT